MSPSSNKLFTEALRQTCKLWSCLPGQWSPQYWSHAMHQWASCHVRTKEQKSSGILMMDGLRKWELAKRTKRGTKNSNFVWLSLTSLPGAHIPVEPQEAFTKVGIPGHASVACICLFYHPARMLNHGCWLSKLLVSINTESLFESSNDLKSISNPSLGLRNKGPKTGSNGVALLSRILWTQITCHCEHITSLLQEKHAQKTNIDTISIYITIYI